MSDLLVKLRIYEGPLDLLLHLIKKNEVELDDIPVAVITAQYLEYLSLMEAMNVEVAADFLVMAATLTQIKSRLLLPREDDPEGEGEAEDELKAAVIDPLLAKLRDGLSYRDAAEVLSRRQFLNSDVFVRGGRLLAEVRSESPAAAEETLAAASLFDLVDAFRLLTEKKKAQQIMQFVVEPKTLAQRVAEIQGFLRIRNAAFAELCAADRNRADLILSFLAVLELARVGFLRLYQNLDHSSELLVFLANPQAEVESLAHLDY